MAKLFPGMDPFIESQGLWPDLHTRLITNLCDALLDRLPRNYEARIEERFQILEYDAESQKLIGPDLSVARLARKSKGASPKGTVTLEPAIIPLAIEEEIRESYLKIIWRPDRSVVAVIEVLSPANKSPSGRIVYLSKRREVLGQSVHLVELDLLLGGRRLPLEKPYPPGDFFALVSRAEQRPDCEVYAWPLSSPLPAIPVPLKSPDADLVVDLGKVLTFTLSRARYGRSINYREPLNSPISDYNKKWVRSILARARRAKKK